MNKYELTKETKTLNNNVILHRIKALKDFGYVKTGELGGWIEKEENLSQEGNCWVYDNAKVCGNARVRCNAKVSGNAGVSGNAEVSGEAFVSGNAVVYGEAKVCGNAGVFGEAEVYDNAVVYGNARVSGNAEVFGEAEVCGNAEVYGNTDILWISKIGSRNDTITFMKSKDLDILVSVGCFCGTLKEFEQKVKETHGNNEHAKAYALVIELAKLRINLKGE